LIRPSRCWTTVAKSYTRGRGFDGNVPNAEIAAAVTLAAARLASNGRQLLVRDKVDDVEREFRSSFQGWSVAELAVLNRYRVTAA
jgi:hypothetical protein